MLLRNSRLIENEAKDIRFELAKTDSGRTGGAKPAMSEIDAGWWAETGGKQNDMQQRSVRTRRGSPMLQPRLSRVARNAKGRQWQVSLGIKS
jgi:hypothetical protein